jgi:hypothetical protein
LTALPPTPKMPRVALANYWSALAGLLLSAGTTCLVPGVAHAEPTTDDNALATLLFEQGRALIVEGHIAEACQKFAESQRLDPSGGTLLNLARCHEEQGLLASAWSEFKAAKIVAIESMRPDRELEADRHISALELRLSRLVILVPGPAQVEGLLIERDGREVGRGAWSTLIPIDGGEHEVRATAPDRQPFRLSVVIAAQSDVKAIEIPILAMSVPIPAVLSPPPSVAALPSMPVSETHDRKPHVEEATFTPERLRWLGIGSAALGAVAWAASGYALAAALDAKEASNSDCGVGGCGDAGLRHRREAVSRGNWATVLGLGGTVLVGAGVTLFYFGLQSNPPSHQTQSSARLVVGVASGTLMTELTGHWQ